MKEIVLVSRDEYGAYWGTIKPLSAAWIGLYRLETISDPINVDGVVYDRSEIVLPLSRDQEAYLNAVQVQRCLALCLSDVYLYLADYDSSL